MKTFITEFTAINQRDGNLVDFRGPDVPATSWGDAVDQIKNKPWLKVIGCCEKTKSGDTTIESTVINAFKVIKESLDPGAKDNNPCRFYGELSPEALEVGLKVFMRHIDSQTSLNDYEHGKNAAKKAFEAATSYDKLLNTKV